MSSAYAEVVVLVEGPTEQRFIKQVLGPYLADKSVYLTPIILDKPGEKGGDVKFARARNDLEKHLKQRRDTWVTLMVDYYGIDGDWPGYQQSKTQATHTGKSQVINRATAEKVQELFAKQNPGERFIPYVSMHEIEALYFSDPGCLAGALGVEKHQIGAILTECGEPEGINDGNITAPSKRLTKLSQRFKKMSTGIAIAQAIGIPKMRTACPLFDRWVARLEQLRPHVRVAGGV